MNKREAEKAKYREYLLETVRPGAVVWCVIRNVAPSGMSRTISMFHIHPDMDPNMPVHAIVLHYNTAKLLGWRYSRSRDGVIVQGCGMDMGFHLVDCLSGALCFTGAQALKHRWL